MPMPLGRLAGRLKSCLYWVRGQVALLVFVRTGRVRKMRRRDAAGCRAWSRTDDLVMYVMVQGVEVLASSALSQAPLR